jgi:PST family polysaccharide transporter
VPLILGPGYEGAVPVLRILAVAIPLRSVSNVLGMQWLLPAGRERAVSLLMALAGVANCAAATVLVPLAQEKGMALAVVLSELVAAGSLFLVARSNGLGGTKRTKRRMR